MGPAMFFPQCVQQYANHFSLIFQEKNIYTSQCHVICWNTDAGFVKKLWDNNQYIYVAYGVSESLGVAQLYLDFKKRTYTHALRKQLEALGSTEITIMTFDNDGGKMAGSAWNSVHEAGKKEQCVWGEFGKCNPTLVQQAEKRRAEGGRRAMEEIRRVALEAGESVRNPTKKRGSEVQSVEDFNKRARTLESVLQDNSYLARFNTQIAKAHADQKEMHKDLDAGQKGIADGQKEMHRELATEQKKIAAGQKELADGQKGIAAGQKELADGQKGIAAGQKELAIKQKKIAAGQKELAIEQKKIVTGQRMLVTELSARQTHINRVEDVNDRQTAIIRRLNNEKDKLIVKLYEKDALLAGAVNEIQILKDDNLIMKNDIRILKDSNISLHRKLDTLLAKLSS
jgi:hypothetical protein